MLKKTDIDRKLRKYIRQNLSRGYSKKSIKDTLVKHGYDESYVNKSIHKETELKFVNKYSILSIILFFVIVAIANLKLIDSGLTGFVINEQTPNKYLVIDLNNVNYTLTINNIKIIEAQGLIGDFENTGYLIVIEGETMGSFYQTLIEGNNQIYLPYNKSMKKIEIYDKSNLMIEIELNKFI